MNTLIKKQFWKVINQPCQSIENDRIHSRTLEKCFFESIRQENFESTTPALAP